MNISHADIEAVMADHLFFGGLSENERATLVDLGRIQSEPSGTILFQHDDSYQGFYLLLEGTIQVYRLSSEGRMLVLEVIRPGESFAEIPLFEDQEPGTYPATSETLADSTMLFIPKGPFLTFVDQNPRTCLHMLVQLAGRLRSTVRQLDAVSLQDVQQRLARYLVEKAPSAPKDADTPPTLELDVPKTVLAAKLGTVPETLSRALRALEEKDFIRSASSAICLTDMQGLRRFVCRL